MNSMPSWTGWMRTAEFSQIPKKIPPEKKQGFFSGGSAILGS